MDPVTLVDSYLACCAERRLDDAARYLAEGAVLVFPGGARYASLEEMVAGARGRYRSIDKHRDTWDVGRREDGAVVVISTGTLFGVNLAGVPFEGVRYVDRFVLRDGLIAEQHVWNDLAESGVLALTAAPTG